MAESARNLSLLTGAETLLGRAEARNLSPEAESGVPSEFLRTLPCVIYECSLTGEVSFVSENITDLLGFDRKDLLGRTSLWDKCIFAEDLEPFRQKMNVLDHTREVRLVHRLCSRWGIPVWVNHALQKVMKNGDCVIRGCFLGVGENLKEPKSGESAVERFVHKLGNHFTLLHVVLGSLRRVLPASRETDVLHETVDRAIELTRSFSQYSQRPSCWLESVDMVQLLEEALLRAKPAFAEKGVSLQGYLDDSLNPGSVPGDPFVLEMAVGHIVQNALEATSERGIVTVEAWAETHRSGRSIINVRIRDTGTGIEEENLRQVWTPFFSTKEGHEGLGLNMAQRFVEMHSGFVRLASEWGKGTEVTITLPTSSKART